MTDGDLSFKQIIQWIAGTIAVIITLIIPAVYFYANHDSLEDKSRVIGSYVASDLSEYVFLNSNTWEYQEARIASIIERQIDIDIYKIFLKTSEDNVLYTNEPPIKKPFLSISEPVYDAGTIVATLELHTSLEPIFLNSLVFFCVAIAIGLIIYFTLYRVPMNALDNATKHLRDAQEELREEVLSKERALKNAHDLSIRLRELAMHDILTGLPNRSMYNDRLSQALLMANRQKSLLAVVMMDLNRFKDINDSLGHHIGDEVLIQVADRLVSSLRKTDTVARLGGDEFALVLHINGKENAINVCGHLSHILTAPIDLQDHGIQLTTAGSFGIAYFPDDGVDSSTLLQRADIAMYAAKKTSTNITVYDEKIDTHSAEKMRLINDLGQAIVNGELYLVYQPKISFATNQVIGVEALIRWQHPIDGFVSPGAFIPLAEEQEVIHPLTEWVIETALEQLHNWLKDDIKLQVSINISGMNLRDNILHHKIAIAMTKWQTDPGSLILEVTESAMIDNPENAVMILKELGDQGIKLSIDDFGTGHASLSQLKSFSFDELKWVATWLRVFISANQ